MKFAILLCASLVAAACASHETVRSQKTLEREMAICRAQKARLGAKLAAAFRDFDKAGSPVPAKVLVDTDRKIRDLLANRPDYRPCEDDAKLIYDSRWKRMSIVPGYEDDLSYTGALLVEAHRRDPHSPLRPFTLFSTVFGETSASGLGIMPDIAAAFAYEREFPNGPYIADVYRTIAGFHSDLFMVLRDRRETSGFECYRPYIGPEPWPEQQARVKRVALDYYGRVINLVPKDVWAHRLRDGILRGDLRILSFCGD